MKSIHFIQSISYQSIITVILLGFTLTSCSEESPPPDLPPRAIKWMQVTPSSGEQQRMISGFVRSLENTYLSFEVGGLVRKVHAPLGAQVKKGQVLAELDTQPFVLKVRDAEAALDRAKATHQNALLQFERVSLLYEDGNAPKAQLDEARAKAESARSQIRAAEAHLGLARRDRQKTVLRAPYNGSISVKNVESFQEVSAGRTMYEIDSHGDMRVEVLVPETFIAQVQHKQKVSVSFPTIDQLTLPATVQEVGTRASQGNAFAVKVVLDKLVPELRPGMTAEVTFTYSLHPLPYGGSTSNGAAPPTQAGIQIPLDATVAGSHKETFVFVFDAESSTVQRTPIEVHALQNNGVVVTGGLKTGDIIATAGVDFLIDGQKVTLLDKQ